MTKHLFHTYGPYVIAWILGMFLLTVIVQDFGALDIGTKLTLFAIPTLVCGILAVCEAVKRRFGK